MNYGVERGWSFLSRELERALCLPFPTIAARGRLLWLLPAPPLPRNQISGTRRTSPQNKKAPWPERKPLLPTRKKQERWRWRGLDNDARFRMKHFLSPNSAPSGASLPFNPAPFRATRMLHHVGRVGKEKSESESAPCSEPTGKEAVFLSVGAQHLDVHRSKN